MMQCNIDQRGRWVRMIGGIITILAGVFVLVFVPGGPAVWIVAGVLFVLGLFQMFEAWKGWCGIRAMGIRTPW